MAELELEIVEVIDDNDDDDDDIGVKRAFESNFARGLAIGLRLQTRLYPRNDWKWKFSDENDAKALDFDQI